MTSTNFSMRLDEETAKMLDDIVRFKEFDNSAQAIRFLVRRYHRKKLGVEFANGPAQDKCHRCRNSDIREVVDKGAFCRVMFCCKTLHDIDEDVNSAKCGMFDKLSKDEMWNRDIKNLKNYGKKV